MANKKTSKRQKRFSVEDGPIVKLKPEVKVTPYNPDEELRNLDSIMKALFECLSDGDTKAFKEILGAHLRALNLSKFSREKRISLRTIHDALSPEGNPSLNTLAKIFHAIAS